MSASTANAETIAEALEELAFLLELKGENPFKVRAHENGARILRTLDTDLETFIERAAAGEVKGIGENLLEKITALHKTGRLPVLEKLRREFPPGLLRLNEVPGLGPKKVKMLYKELKIGDLEALEAACKSGKVATLEGFGEKTQEKILAGIEQLRRYSGRTLLATALEQAMALVRQLTKSKLPSQISLGGSLRRSKETIGDIDIVAASSKPEKLMEHFVKLPEVKTVVAAGETKSSVLLESGIAVDLRVVSEKEYPAALQYFTGSKEHNTALRSIAQAQGLKLNEYGLFDGEKALPLRDEADIYKRLALCYIPPEAREDSGELEFAAKAFKTKQAFPALLEMSDLQGVLHAHSTYSDGKHSLREMALAAKARGYRYLGITDHSQSAAYAGGLTPARVKEQHGEVEELNEELAPFRIFRGIESDILADGSLDYSDSVLSSFEFVIASVHSLFNLSEKEMTARVIRAVKNPFTTILGHPSGRLLLRREPYAINISAVLEAAADAGTAVELNCNPYRMDLDWRLLRKARELGISIPICPDAHAKEELGYLEQGVSVARKGWMVKDDVPNALSVKDIERWFKRKLK